MGIEEEYPKGVCKVCYQKDKQVRPLMQIGGKYQCPNCASQHSESSGLVNTIKDPGHEAFASGKVDSMEAEYEEVPEVPETVKEVVVSSKNLNQLIKKANGSERRNDYMASLTAVYNILHSQPVQSLPHAKHLLKLKKKVLLLQSEIKLFLEEK
jgi:hypothetical protein